MGKKFDNKLIFLRYMLFDLKASLSLIVYWTKKYMYNIKIEPL